MRIDSPHRLFYRFHFIEKMGTNKNGWARNAQPLYNSQVHSPTGFKSRWVYAENQTPRRLAGTLAFSLLLNKSIVCPEALRVAIGGIHKFDIMADHAHNAETGVLRRGDALISGEEFLHLLLFAGLRMLIGSVEFIFRQAAIRIGLELDRLLRLDHGVLRLNRSGSQTRNGENKGDSHFHIFLRCGLNYSG
jgi:hypothetical protein